MFYNFYVTHIRYKNYKLLCYFCATNFVTLQRLFIIYTRNINESCFTVKKRALKNIIPVFVQFDPMVPLRFLTFLYTGCPILNGLKVQNPQNSSRGSRFPRAFFLFRPCFRNNRKKPSILVQNFWTICVC